MLMVDRIPNSIYHTIINRNIVSGNYSFISLSLASV